MVGCQTSRSHYESAPYRVLKKAGAFEVREYPSLHLVETPWSGRMEKRNTGFRKLFRYISGQNEAALKIPMTTPVFISAQTEEAEGSMAFVMPIDRRAEEIPKPSDESVKLRRMRGGMYAVCRFSGRTTKGNEEASLKKLQGWMGQQGLRAAGEAVWGYFDPPWTLPFLKRNEVMVPVSVPVR